ncbi:hypothetical protein CMV_020440 [Castanea mollissima]|uniref:Uncharacterized protein n=1 Tax=Castanea mollissima TaxID=60419 RepID=A0A8J4QVX2_9ROSI|nr:hypothetical protein CMV_020440 [Castanea mollissima]
MLTSLEVLDSLTLWGCNSLRDLPDGIYKLQRLRVLWTPTAKLRPTCNSFDSSSENCPLLDYESPRGLLNQVIEIVGVLPKGVCGSARSNELMDPQFTDYFPSETKGAESESESESEDGDISQFSNCLAFSFRTEGVEYEDEDIDRYFSISGTEIPWFNHQSVENNSILFWVGRKFPKLAIYFAFAFGGDEAHDSDHYIYECYIYISINGCKKRKCMPRHTFGSSYNLLYLYSPPQRHDDVDYWSELPFYGSDDLEAKEEEYQSPLVLNDTSRNMPQSKNYIETVSPLSFLLHFMPS